MVSHLLIAVFSLLLISVASLCRAHADPNTPCSVVVNGGSLPSDSVVFLSNRLKYLFAASTCPGSVNSFSFTFLQDSLALDSFAVSTVISDSKATYTVRMSGDIADHMHGLYYVLKQLGFGFFHPLETLVPPALHAIDIQTTVSYSHPTRSYHFHSMHPLEYTPYLNGFGIRNTSLLSEDQADFEAVAFAEWPLVCEWLIAAGVNSVSWVLLEAESFANYSASPDRMKRLGQLVDIAHGFGLKVGVDVPIFFQQQHSWRLVPGSYSSVSDAISQMRTRMDVLRKYASWDFFETEMGSSEFTKTSDVEMVALLNATATYIAPLSLWVKVHCSEGQKAPSYGDINYNFIAEFTVPNVVLLPHTVQLYSLNDSAFNTYDNQNFTYMLDYMKAVQDGHDTLFYGETAYWVNYDISMGLLLPSYFDRRAVDYELIREQVPRAGGFHTFHSGFEWGYWLNDISMMVMFERSTSMVDMDSSSSIWALLEHYFGGSKVEFLQSVVDAQTRWLIDWNGMGYLAGEDTWSEVGALSKVYEQPPREVTLFGVYFSESDRLQYRSKVRPSLSSMTSAFVSLSDACRSLQNYRSTEPRPTMVRSDVATGSWNTEWRNAARATNDVNDFWDEICDGVEMLALRSQQVLLTYDSAANRTFDSMPLEQVMRTATKLVAHRSSHLRVQSSERLNGWIPQNPTAYNHMYLWTVDRLFFMWRDVRRLHYAVHSLFKDGLWPWSPCLLNKIDPWQIAGIGEGGWSAEWSKIMAWVIAEQEKWHGHEGEALLTCLSAPKDELIVSDWSIFDV